MKYYAIRILAGLFFMGAIGGGFIAGAECGKWVGWLCFIALLSIGIILHISASKITKAYRD
jgi:hypothetical protein